MSSIASLFAAVVASSACGGGGDDVIDESGGLARGHQSFCDNSSVAVAQTPSPALSWAGRPQNAYQIRSVSITKLALGGTTTYQGLPTGSPQVAGRPAPATACRSTTPAMR